MTEGRSSNLFLVFVLAVYALAIVYLGLGADRIFTEIGAAWTQAVMSVAAIVTGFALAHWQMSKAANEAKISGLESIVAIAEAAQGIAVDFRAHAGAADVEKYKREFDHSKANRIRDALHAIPLHQLGSPRIVKAVLNADVEFSTLLGVLAEKLAPFDYESRVSRCVTEITASVRILNTELEHIKVK